MYNTVRRTVTTASVIGLLTACLVGGPAIAASPLHADQLTCGATITTDTKLADDLIDCPNNGLVIGADNLTLDLNGHTIDGDGTEFTECAPDQPCDIGIIDIDHHGVTIKDGSIEQFVVDVIVADATASRLSRLVVSDSSLFGLFIVNSSAVQLDKSTASANGLTTDQAGIVVFDSHDLQLKENTASGNGDIGMYMIGVDNTRIARNTLTENPEAGIILEGSGNEVTENRARGGQDGVIVAGNENVVARNQLTGTACTDGCGVGISLEGGNSNLAERNVVADFHQAGIRVASFGPEGGPPISGTTISRNVVRNSDVDGVLVESTAVDTLLERNIATGAGDDGIDVRNAATTLSRNLTLHNADLGIEAVPGVTDAGRNTANANGNPAQCTNVICESYENRRRSAPASSSSSTRTL